MKTEVLLADYANEQHATDIVSLLDHYARDPMGGGAALPDNTKSTLVNKLASLPNAFSVLSYVDGQAAGLANCFEGFSTFQCKPLVNIHDVVVNENFRGLGISLLMLAKIESIAQEKGCCKITLEVLEGNETAKSAYARFGFEGYELNPAMGKALFWQKPI